MESPTPHIDVPRLIEEVERRPLLWDLSHWQYVNRPLKERAWGLVGDACGCTGPQAQAKFKNLRTCYNRRRNKYVPSGSGAEAAARPGHAYDLSFLDRVPRHSETTSNLVLPPPSQAVTAQESFAFDLTTAVPSPAALVEVELEYDTESETQFSPPTPTQALSTPTITSSPATATTVTTATSNPSTSRTATYTPGTTTTVTSTPGTNATVSGSTATLTSSMRREGKRKRSETPEEDKVDSQLVAELGQLRQLKEAAASTQKFDPECVHWGNIVMSEMQGLCQERRKRFKSCLIDVLGELYEK